MEHEPNLPMCLSCGGLLTIRVPGNDDIDQSTYVCSVCGRKPTAMIETPVQKNLGASYVPNLGKKEPRTL